MRLFQAGLRESPTSEGFRLTLTEIEAQSGASVSLNRTENFPSGKSLSHFQKRLRPSEALLSFELGGKKSFLWVITQNTLNAYQIAGKASIQEAVLGFREAIETGHPDRGRSQQLYGMLLGGCALQKRSGPNGFSPWTTHCSSCRSPH